jgi:Rrf2 family protein
MRVTARADYALRACAELAVAGDHRLKRDEIATRQDIPIQYLESVLLALKHAGIVQSLRGASGGFRLARPATDISLADVIRGVDGPMADVRGDRPEEVEYRGPARRLKDIWVALRASLREILEGTSLDDLVRGELAPEIERLLGLPDAWVSLNRSRGGPQLKTATRAPRSARG